MYNGLLGQKLLGEVLDGKTDAALPVVGEVPPNADFVASPSAS